MKSDCYIVCQCGERPLQIAEAWTWKSRRAKRSLERQLAEDLEQGTFWPGLPARRGLGLRGRACLGIEETGFWLESRECWPLWRFGSERIRTSIRAEWFTREHLQLRRRRQLSLR